MKIKRFSMSSKKKNFFKKCRVRSIDMIEQSDLKLQGFVEEMTDAIILDKRQ